MGEKKIKLSPPWVTYYRELEELFGKDPAIKMEFDDKKRIIKFYVDGTDKAEALTKLLPAVKSFGAVTVQITIIPANFRSESKVALFQKAFEGNPVFSYVQTVEGAFTNPINYIVFKHEVVQFFNDDLSDVNGNRTTLYQDLAKDVFGNNEGVFFCTDTDKNTGKPLGEWP